MDPRNEQASRYLELARQAVLRALKVRGVAPWELGIDDAESLAQQVYMRILERGSEIRLYEHVVWQTADNTVIDALRYTRRRRSVSSDNLGDVQDDARSHEDDYARAEESHALIDEVLELLSPGEQGVVEAALKLNGNLSNNAAIGEMLGVEPNPVAASVYRIRKKAQPLKPRFDELESR
jgi:DNA-directed RNA polymerase specialized sigma24 family protein